MGEKSPDFFVNSVNRSNVEQTEVCLVDRAAAGDREARRQLYVLHREAAYLIALRVTRREQDALDAVQDGFIRAFERLGDFQHESGFKTWLLRIVSNRALDLLRARKVRLAVPLDSGDDGPGPDLAVAETDDRPDRGLEARELAERLHEAINSLPADQRAAFALYATGDMTYGQIAEVLGIPIGTVMSRLYHARRRLHEMLPDLASSGAGRDVPT